MIQQYNLSHQTKGEQSGCKPPKLRRVGMPWGIWFRKFNVQLCSPRSQVIESQAIFFLGTTWFNMHEQCLELNFPIVRICELHMQIA